LKQFSKRVLGYRQLAFKKKTIRTSLWQEKNGLIEYFSKGLSGNRTEIIEFFEFWIIFFAAL
jgi:hypothetical protein